MRLISLLLCLLVALWAAPAPAATLVAHYDFEDGAGDTSTPDTASGTRPGTLQGSPAYVAGKVGSWALEFDGDGEYVDVTNTTDLLTGASGATIAAWIMPKATFSQDDPMFISTNSSTSSGRIGVTLGFDDNGSGVDIRGGGRSDDNDGYQFVDTGSGLLPQNQWRHIAVVLDYDADDVYVYVNGNVEGQDTDAGFGSSTSDSDDPLDFHIGDIGTLTGRNFVGVIDDVRVYEGALSQQEVLALVPEPGTGILGLIGAVLLAGVAARRRSCRHG